MMETWQRWALGIAAGVILGGGTSAFVGKSYTDETAARLTRRIDAVEQELDRSIATDLEMIKVLTRVETQVEGLRRDIVAMGAR